MHSTKSASPTSQNSPNALKAWVLAARPKTLIASISPVLIGASFAAHIQPISFGFFALCFLFSLTIQIGTNFANDAFDYMSGADTISRKGPARAVQSGWISPLVMRNTAFGTFGFALLVALPLLVRIGITFLPLAILCPVAGALYTGGKKPLGYLGLGDLLVFIFYGPVAVCCTVLSLLLYLPEHLFLASLPPGLLSCALLAAANLRDWKEDRKCGKMTLIARFGPIFGKIQYLTYLFLGIVFVPLILVLNGMPLSLLQLWWVLPLAFIAVRLVFKDPLQHERALPITSAILLLYTLIWCYVLLYV